SCRNCGSAWYFQRTFCPRCGSASPQVREASGLGTVHARALVTRAPSEELRAHAPYLIVLVDTDEGFRMMAHGDQALQIGDRVRVRFSTLGSQLVPYFDRTSA